MDFSVIHMRKSPGASALFCFRTSAVVMLLAAAGMAPVMAEEAPVQQALAAQKANPPLKASATALFLEREGKLHQAVLVDLASEPNREIVVKSEAGEVTHASKDLSRFQGRLVVPVPPKAKTQWIELSARDTGRRARVELPPARRWTVYIIPHTHLDIGYTDLQENIWVKLAENLDGVIDLCRETTDWPEGAQYRWTIEQTALFENFANRYPQERVDALAALIREGRVELTGYWVNLLTELAGPEGLIRATYPARRIAERYGVDVDTVMLDDVPGYTWFMPQIWSNTGMRYASLRPNKARAKFIWDRPGAVPRPFRWQSPDGSEILCWYSDNYGEANFLRRGFPGEASVEKDGAVQKWLHDHIMAHLRRAADAGYNRDILPLSMGGDNLTSAESVCHWVRYWNARWAFPRLVLATNREFFEALDDQKRDIPVCRGDIPDWWADGAASSAEQTGQARIAHDDAVALETLCALPGGPMDALPPGEETSPARELAAVRNLMPGGMDTQPATPGKTIAPNLQALRQKFHEIHRDILLYDEHTWGASKRFWQRNDMKMVNGQWAVKRGFVDSGRKRLDQIRKQWNGAVDDWIESETNGIMVWNTLSWPRSDLVEIDAKKLPERFGLRGPDGEETPVCRSEKDRWAFVAKNVPPLGYAFYEITVSSAPETATANTHAPQTSRYEVCFDEERGLVTSIINTTNGRNLLQQTPRYGFNQYLYEDTGTRNAAFPVREKIHRAPREKHVIAAAPAELVVQEKTPVFEKLVTRTHGRQAPLLEQTYTVYPELDWVDIRNRIQKTATLDTEEVYFAFPLEIDSPQCRLEIPFGCMRPGKDQLSYSATDFYSIYHWVELWNHQGGILWASIEAPVVVFGDLWPECWTDRFTLESGMLFSYVMNNCWGTNYRFEQGGDLTFRYRLRDYQGKPDRVRAFRFGYEACVPLVTRVARCQAGNSSQNQHAAPMPSTRSWFSVEPEHVMITSMKHADTGRGLIVRLVELGRGQTTARLALPEGNWKAAKVNLVEREPTPLTVETTGKSKAVAIPMNQSEIVTVRLVLLDKQPTDNKRAFSNSSERKGNLR